VKSWIQHFISWQRRQCYSPQRKTVACDCVSTTWVKQYHCEESPLIAVDQWNLKLTKRAKIFIKLNLKDVYHCIAYVSAMRKTVFHTHYESLWYLIMSFELANAPATFQAYINWALAEHMNFICVVYLNNIIYSQLKEHKHHVCEILEQLQHYKLFVNLRKCVFYWHCRVSEIYSVNHWDDNEFTTNWHY
jgi:hypothetical protein